jgi:hypothetical protein
MIKQHRLGLSFIAVGLAVVALAASLALGSSVRAAGGSVSAGEATVEAGGSAAIDVTAVAPTTGIGNWTIDVTFDSLKLQATDCAPNAAGGCQISPGGAAGTVRLAGATGLVTGLTGTQVLGKITLKDIGGTAGQCSALTLTLTAFDDGAGTDARSGLTKTNGKVCVEAAATQAPSATASPKPAPVSVGNFGGSPADGSSSVPAWLLVALGLPMVIGGGWALARRRHENR